MVGLLKLHESIAKVDHVKPSATASESIPIETSHEDMIVRYVFNVMYDKELTRTW